jgi:AraC-like DNA-binding protein
VLSERDIQASNVLPTYLTSLEFGATEAELDGALGWRRSELLAKDTWVSGHSTYLHLELMHRKPRYGEFVVAAASSHRAASLGVVGLACKTAQTVRDAIHCHERFQHLTNRSAQYRSHIDGNRWFLREERPGPSRLGSMLVSDYAMLVAAQLLTTLLGRKPRIMCVRSRRTSLPHEEREHLERFFGAPIRLRASGAALELDAALWNERVPAADGELQAFFRAMLERATPARALEPALLDKARAAIRDRLVHGQPTVASIGRDLGLGGRTLQRRLREHDMSFAQLMNDTRRDLAEGYLQNPDLSLAEVAYLLGYREQASFFRAFRRWHAVTPDEFRERRPLSNT